ncbi:MAG: TIGR04282 family arsenosugar biosynthesis glycosyltransferase [Sediminibacterium sp.]
MKTALIIFVRNPVLGKVKTRLAKVLGEEEALAVYRQLLQHTQSITRELICDRYVFYADFLNETDSWQNAVYRKYLQEGAGLGDRMRHAFETLFKKGYDRVCIIGSDCMNLTVSIVEDAFSMLAHHDAVIGPSSDGGYYLLGMKRLIPALFAGKEWSTDKVFTSTVNDIERLGLTSYLLPVIPDIDTAEDWHHFTQTINKPKK